MARHLHAAGLLCVLIGLTGCRAAPPKSIAGPSPISVATTRRSYEYFVYHARRGDTLYSLGRRFGVSWEEIADASSIKHPEELKVGMALLIPRTEGVDVPELAIPEPEPQAGPRRAVPKRDLHRGRPSSRFWWPTSGRVVRRYGEGLRGLPESGIAIAAPAGTEVYAAAPGTVIAQVSADASAGSAWGNVLAISHPGGMVSWYAHLDSVFVQKGRRVSKGEPVGAVGTSGAAVRPELAFRLFRNERPINPMDHLP